jgi:hypothetical protein
VLNVTTMASTGHSPLSTDITQWPTDVIACMHMAIHMAVAHTTTNDHQMNKRPLPIHSTPVLHKLTS